MKTEFLTRCIIATLLLFGAVGGHGQAGKATTQPSVDHDRMPITTSSPEARVLFEQGVVEWENLHITRALEHWQAAIQKDPNFLLAHLYISERVPDSGQQAAERKKVMELMSSATPAERLMAEWINNASSNDIIGAIAAMNELLARYPRDKHLHWFAALSLGGSYHQWEHAAAVAEEAVRVDPDFAGALNNLAYDYAFQGQFDKAFPVMQHYIEVLPGEPNPQDSYAEILRMAGRFDQAIEHYHAALKIEPNFEESLLGLADTYALMGEEDKARAQYEVAIQHAYTKVYVVMWRLRWAATYVREKRFKEADAAFQNAAQIGHDNSAGQLEAEAFRIMALYQQDYPTASRWLQKAEQALAHPHDTSHKAQQQELAAIRRTAVQLAIKQGHLRVASDILAQLNKMADESHNPAIEIAYHAAAGMVLTAKQEWLEAIPHLEEDATGPFSMQLLVTAYEKAGFSAKSDRLARALVALNTPSIEQALVVPEFRSARSKAGKTSASIADKDGRRLLGSER